MSPIQLYADESAATMFIMHFQGICSVILVCTERLVHQNMTNYIIFITTKINMSRSQLKPLNITLEKNKLNISLNYCVIVL